jgi:hypothetical protein
VVAVLICVLHKEITEDSKNNQINNYDVY